MIARLESSLNSRGHRRQVIRANIGRRAFDLMRQGLRARRIPGVLERRPGLFVERIEAQLSRMHRANASSRYTTMTMPVSAATPG